MKKIVLFLLVTIPLFGYSQSKDYKSLNSESDLVKSWNTDYVSVNSIADNLFSLLNKTYIRENYTNRAYHYVVSFYPDEFNRDNDVPSVSFTFTKGTIGANNDLGITGKRVFNLYEIEGIFLDLYVIWEKLCSDLNTTPESKDIILSKPLKRSEEIFWLNSEKRDCAIQLHRKDTGNSSRWIIMYKVYAK
ncbi:hypothetical protein [Dysgonomonas sp. ZJ279]|uniref:hypothetical protein n=1 Tax=Dysgonomonas sp. ZJ279 TaxID=2709796 RepID=UPI0013EDFA5F|nr:hypothetical protein [Dysgonomonas sp. ZJ279]